MFWLTSDAVIAGRLQEVVARGRTMPPLLNPLFNVAQRPHDGGRAALGLALEGVQVGRLTVRWEWLRARSPVERRWIGVLPITALYLNPDGSSALYPNRAFRDTVIPNPRMRWRRFVELVEAIRSRQADPDERLDAPTGTLPTARPDPGRPDLLWWIDGATGELSTTSLETTPDKHWWPGARTGWRDYRMPRIAERYRPDD